MEYKYWVMLYITVTIVVVLICFLATKIKDEKIWKNAAEPNDKYHGYLLKVQERIQEKEEQKDAFLAMVYFEKRRPKYTQKDIDEVNYS